MAPLLALRSMSVLMKDQIWWALRRKSLADEDGTPAESTSHRHSQVQHAWAAQSGLASAVNHCPIPIRTGQEPENSSERIWFRNTKEILFYKAALGKAGPQWLRFPWNCFLTFWWYVTLTNQIAYTDIIDVSWLILFSLGHNDVIKYQMMLNFITRQFPFKLCLKLPIFKQLCLLWPGT